MRRIILNALVAVTSLAATLAVVELVLRLHHGPYAPPSPTPYRTVTPEGPRLIPGVEVPFLFESTTEPVWVRVNSLGLRGPELPPSSRGRRVLFLGDSVTFGYGVEEDSTFVALFGHDRAGEGVVAVNGGVEDSGILEERRLLERVGSLVGPSAVVLCFYPNDARPPVGFAQEYLHEDPLDRWFRRHPHLLARWRLAGFFHFRYRTLLMRLHLYQGPIPARFAWVDAWREGGWRHDPLEWQRLVAEARYDWGAGWEEDTWEAVTTELRKILRWCDEHDAVLGVCYFPVQVEVEGPIDASIPASRLGQVCETLGLPFLDLAPILRGCGGCFIDQCHLTPEGHRRVASALGSWIPQWWTPSAEQP